jgi:hypothetical protein
MWMRFSSEFWESKVLRTLATLVALLALAGALELVRAQGKPRTISSPTLFEPEDHNTGFEDAQAPSDAVLDVLLEAVRNDGPDDELERMNREQKRARFEAVRVNLGKAADEGYVVLGKPPMIGADCDWFWIVRMENGRAKVLLFTNGLALYLRKHSTAGYRDIVVSWATAAFTGDRIYGFDGSTYKLIRERTKEQTR